MSSTTSQSPITKVIFLQKIFRFAGRTVEDLVIINFVCKDFEETMQAHHTFNLVLYDNIIKKRKDVHDFLEQSIAFLATAPAWIVYQWTVVNESDERQRQWLEVLLLFQARNENTVLLREPSDVKDEDPSTTRELFCHILDSCVQLGIAKQVLETSSSARWNCIMQAVTRKISADCFKVLLDSCVRHGLDLKKMLEQKDGIWNCIMVASHDQLPTDSFKVLIECCIQHGVGMKKMLEEQDRSGYNCITAAVHFQWPVDSFKLLIESCIQFGLDMKRMLEQKDVADFSCIMVAVRDQCPVDSFNVLIELCIQHGVGMKKILEHKDFIGENCLSLSARHALNVDCFRLLIAHFPSDESFRATLSAKRINRKSAVDYAKTEEIKTLMEDPDCWHKCREWCTSNGIRFLPVGQESGTRRERE